MKTAWKAALAVLAVAGTAAATPAAAQSFGLGIGPRGGITFSYDSGGYCDEWGCPDDFWDMPVYYGPVFWGGEWYDGPVYYRDWYGRRQFWIRGAWRFDEWRGPRPGWWREGRYGPPLGENFYRNNGFHGRWDRGFGQRDDRRDFGGPDQRRDFGQRDDRQNFGQRDNRQQFDRRDESGPRSNGSSNFQGRAMNRQEPAPQAAPERAPQPAPQAPIGGRAGRGGFQPQAQPQQAAPERNGNGRDRNDDRGRRDRDNH